MPKFVKRLKDTSTPHIFHTVSQHHSWLTIIGVSFALMSLGFALVLVRLYSRILVLEAAINVLASK